jgi:photosystem II stability/assembly factor-like uncharacterized protein
VARVATREKRGAARRRQPTTPSRLPWLIGGVIGLVAVGIVAWLLLRPNPTSEVGAIATLQTLDQHALLFSPTDPNVAFFGHHNGIMRSDDAGQTWTKLAAQPPGEVTALASAGGEPELLFAGTAASGVVRSVDGGASWSRASGQTGSEAAFRAVLALAVDAASRETLYAGTDSGLAKSTDGGATWSALAYPGENAVAVAVSPADPRVVLAVATSPRRQGLVYRSEDGGASWGNRR